MTPLGGGAAFLNPAINILGKLYGNIKVLGAILPSGIVINGVPNISEQDLKSLDYDLILVVDNKIAPILKKAENLNINIDKIVKAQTVCVPLFTLEKYNKLRHSQITIFSKDCFGGNIYNMFGLPFLSPTINLWFSDEDFIKFLRDPINIIRKQLVFQRTEFERNIKINYPVFSTGEVEWHMNHYPNFDVALKKWYERSYRINWFNIFVVMSTKNPNILAEFDKLPYTKKICFVPFETDLDSGFYLDISKYNTDDLDALARMTSKGELFLYDYWDILLYGKKTPLKN